MQEFIYNREELYSHEKKWIVDGDVQQVVELLGSYYSGKSGSEQIGDK